MARVDDVTERLLADVHGPGDRVRRVHQTKAPRKLSPSLIDFFTKWEQSGRNTVGFVSNAMAYGHAIEGGRPSYHTNMIKLIKGGHIKLCQVDAPPPEGTSAYRDSRYGQKFYYLAAGTCPTELDPATMTNLRGARRRRR